MQPICTNCGSEKLIPDVRVIDTGYGAGKLLLGVDAKPHAKLFKDTVVTGLRAEVCASCGYTRLFAESTVQLYEAHQQRLRS